MKSILNTVPLFNKNILAKLLIREIFMTALKSPFLNKYTKDPFIIKQVVWVYDTFHAKSAIDPEGHLNPVISIQ